MLIELDRKSRVSKIKSLATSKENQFYSLYFDYYNGDHFTKINDSSTDYGFNNVYRLETRSGISVFDTFSEEDRVPVKCNWCRPIVDNIADFTRGINEPIEVTSEDKEKDIQDIWKKNKIDIKTHEIAYETGIYGKTYLRIRRREKGSPIEIFNVDPGAVYEVKNPLTEDTEAVIYFFAILKSDAKRIFEGVPIEGELDGWVYYAEEWTDKQVFKFIDGIQVESSKTLNPYGFVPFVEVKGNIYSVSDVHDVVSLNDEININLTYINEIFRYHAFPIYAPKGNYDGQNIIPPEALKEVEISPKTFLNFPTERIEGKGFDESMATHLENLKKDISVVAGVPLKLLMAEVDGNTSGIALQRMMSTIIKQAEQRRNYIADAYKKINGMILTLLGGNAEAETDILFPDILKIDTNERLDEALKKQTLGISKETIFEELGYDYEEENSKMQEEWDQSLDKRLRDEELAISKNSTSKPKKGTPPNQRKAA